MKNRHHFDEYGIELKAFDFKVFKNTISGKFYSFDEDNKQIDEIYLIKIKNEKTGQVSVKNYTKTIKNIFKKNRDDYNNVSNDNEKKLLEYLSSFDIVPIYSFTSLLKKLSLDINIINNPELLRKILKINYDC